MRMWGHLFKVKVERETVFQHDNNTNQTSQTTKEWLKKKKSRVMNFRHQSSDLILIAILQGDF